MTRHRQVHVWVSDETYLALVRLARQNDETIAAIVRKIFRRYVLEESARTGQIRRPPEKPGV